MRSLLSVLALVPLVACSPSGDEPDGGSSAPDSSSLPDGSPPPDGAYSTVGACTDDVEPAPRRGRFPTALAEGTVTLTSATASGAGAELTFASEDGEKTITSPLPIAYWTPWVGTPFDATRQPFGVQLANDEGTVVGFLGYAYGALRLEGGPGMPEVLDLGPLMVEVTRESCWVAHEHRVGEADCGIVPITHYQASIDGVRVDEKATMLIDGYAIHNELIGVRGEELYLECADDWQTNFVLDFVAIRSGDAG